MAKGKRSKIHMYLPNKKIEDPEGQMTSMKAEFDSLWDAVKENCSEA